MITFTLIRIITFLLFLGVFPLPVYADLKANTERLNRYLEQLSEERLEREKQERIERERQHQTNSAVTEQRMSTNAPGDSTVSAPTQLVRIETDVFEIRIDIQGAVIKSVKLKKYPVDEKYPNKYFEIIHSKFNSVYVIQTGLRSSNSPAPTHYSTYSAEREHYNMETGQDVLRVPFIWKEDGLQVTKTYTLRRGDYQIDVDHLVVNQSSQDWSASQYRQITRTRPLGTSNLLSTYTGAVVYNDAVKYVKVDFDDMEEQQLQFASKGGWVAMIQHNFLSAWIAGEQENNLMYSIASQKRLPNTYTIGIRSDNLQVKIGAEGRFNSQLYIGPKLIGRLKAISTGLELTVDQEIQQQREERELKRLDIAMVSVPGGCFQMGNISGAGNEKPVHEVCLKGFKMGKYEVTQGQWRTAMGSNPSYFSSCGDDCPVEQVSWNDIQNFLQQLNRKTGLNFRLSSEAEWEYACRGGVANETYCGGNEAGRVSWYNKNSGNTTLEVGGKAPNAFGLYDMSGNVYEWAEDCWNANYHGAPHDGSAWQSGDCQLRVLRGGSVSKDDFLRAPYRTKFKTDNRANDVGFRLLLQDGQ